MLALRHGQARHALLHHDRRQHPDREVQSPDDRRGRRGDDRAHRSLEAPPQQAVRESSGLDMHRIAPKLRLRRKLRNHSLPVHAPDGIIHVFKYIDRNSHETLH